MINCWNLRAKAKRRETKQKEQKRIQIACLLKIIPYTEAKIKKPASIKFLKNISKETTTKKIQKQQ